MAAGYLVILINNSSSHLNIIGQTHSGLAAGYAFQCAANTFQRRLVKTIYDPLMASDSRLVSILVLG